MSNKIDRVTEIAADTVNVLLHETKPAEGALCAAMIMAMVCIEADASEHALETAIQTARRMFKGYREARTGRTS